jgi:hypothetical protein
MQLTGIMEYWNIGSKIGMGLLKKIEIYSD